MHPANKGLRGFLRAAGNTSSMLAWTETGTLTVGFLVFCVWLRPWDPFFLASLFPWTWLAPILMALRHGSKSALLSSLLLVLAWILARHGFYPLHGDFPKPYFLGGFIASLSCGEFRDLWQAEINRERKAKEHLEQRLDSLARSHQALSLSHDRMQAGLLAHPPTLRDALAELRAGGQIPGHPSSLEPEGAQAFLTLLARFFQLETAALYRVGGNGPEAKPLAALGPVRDLDGSDPLVSAALDSGRLCHALQDKDAAAPGRYLFAASLETSEGEILALLAVEKMPFFAFQEENLRALFSVLGYYAGLLAGGEAASIVTRKLPDCPLDFAAEYLRLHRLRAEAGLESSLAAAFLPADPDPLALAREAGRGLDLFWLKRIPDSGAAVIALLPFCGESQALVFLSRLEAKGKHPSASLTTGGHAAAPGDLSVPGAGHMVAVMGAGDPIAELEQFLSGLRVRKAGTDG